MKRSLSALLVLSTLATGVANAQQLVAADGYRTCPADQTTKGLRVVETACGTVDRPDFSTASFSGLSDLQEAESQRDAFATSVKEYGQCVTRFINSYRRPGADANSTAPDEAACAHSWAEDQITQTVMEFGRACVDFSNRSMTDRSIDPWSGACYPAIQSENG